MFATAEELIEVYEKRTGNPYAQAALLNLGNRGFYYSHSSINSVPKQLTVERAKEILSSIKESYQLHLLGKGDRPWHLFDLTKDLDPKQAWIGVEYETGYSREEHYRSVVNYIWRASLHSVIDDEGCGHYPCEITFAPVNVSDFKSSRYIMDRFLKRNKRVGIEKAEHDTRDMVGTHVNISTPSFRQNVITQEAVGCVLGNSVGNMSVSDCEEVFGRMPYGSIENMNGYLEGKLFDSTDSIEVWEEYKKVMLRIADVVEYVSANFERLDLDDDKRISNFGEILKGNATPEEAVFDQWEDPDGDSWW